MDRGRHNGRRGKRNRKKCRFVCSSSLSFLSFILCFSFNQPPYHITHAPLSLACIASHSRQGCQVENCHTPTAWTFLRTPQLKSTNPPMHPRKEKLIKNLFPWTTIVIFVHAESVDPTDASQKVWSPKPDYLAQSLLSSLFSFSLQWEEEEDSMNGFHDHKPLDACQSAWAESLLHSKPDSNEWIRDLWW